MTRRSRVGDRVTLACACEAEVLVPMIIMLPRHHVVRIVRHGEKCHGLGHARGRRAVVRWRLKGGRRVFKDIHEK